MIQLARYAGTHFECSWCLRQKQRIISLPSFPSPEVIPWRIPYHIISLKAGGERHSESGHTTRRHPHGAFMTTVSIHCRP